MNSPKTLAALIVAASLAGLAGIAHADNKHRMMETAPRTAHTGARISMERAIAIAQKHVPNGRVKKAELDHEQGRLVYEVDLVTRDRKEYDVKVDARTGKVISSRVDWDD
ncbi:MAG: PepSY domain-containing protein [Brachymonas sp.]|nr:PepSY domain-containing protein [Brachymonas sp.]